MAGILSDLMLRLRANSADLQKGVERAKSSVGSFDKSIKKTSRASEGAFSKMSKSAGGAFSQIAGSMSSMGPAGSAAAGGFKSMAGGAAMLNVALGPIGIILGIIAIALKAVMSYFKGTTEGAAKFAGIMGYLKGFMAGFQEIFIRLGKWIVWAFENPQESVKQLWEIIKQNLLNRWEGMIEFFKKSFSALSNGFKGVGLAVKGIFDKEAREKSKEYFAEMKKDMIDVGKAAFKMQTGMDLEKVIAKGAEALAEMNRIAKATAQIEKEAFQLRVDRLKLSRMESKAQADIANLRLKAEDAENATLSERIDSLNRAGELETSIANAKLEAAAKEVELQKRRMALTSNSIEDEEKLVELQNNLDSITRERDQGLQSLIRRQTALNNLIRKYGEDSINMTQAEAEEYQKASAEKLKLEEQFQNYKLSLVSDTQDGELAILQNNYAKGIMLAEEYELRKAELAKKYAKIAEEDRLKEIERARAEEFSLLDAILSNERNSYAARQEALKEMLDKKLISYEDYFSNVKDLNRNLFEDLADMAMSGLDSISGFFTAAKEKELKAAGDNADARAKIEEKFAKKQKKIAIAQALINGALGVTKAFGQTGVLGFITAGLIAAQTAAQIAVINAQSFAKGGIVYGETLATVGDYAGARNNPEIIAPLDKLKNLMGSSMGMSDVKFVIEGDKLVGILQNENNKYTYF